MRPLLRMHLLPTVILILTAAILSSSACPRRCRCDGRRTTVYCNGRGLLRIPFGIPRNTTTLYLQNNRLANSPNLDKILSSLTQLRRLDLSNNSLTSFPKNLPSTLTQVAMKDNDIKYIGSRSLGRLNKLQKLILDNNSITNQGVSPSAFIGATNLRSISLQWNRLTSLPGGLPSGIKMAVFTHNLISSVSQSSVRDLRNLVTLKLSNNKLTSDSFEENALRPLIELRYLDLSHNKLTYVPACVPGNVTSLSLSHNLIKAINEPVTEQRRAMSFSRLTFLEDLDLSFNRLKWVEPQSLDALISLKTVMLNENPWQCDCHLKYLKKWISTTMALMSGESKTICFTPEAFQSVTLQSLDHDSLTCTSKQVPEYNISISPRSITLLWDVSNSNYPEYVEYKAFCGVPKCKDCSQGEIIDSALREEYMYVSSIVASHAVFPTEYTDAENGNARIHITNREPGKLYIVCMMESSKDIADLTIEDCKFVTTTSEATAPPGTMHANEALVPVWLAVLIALLAILVLAAIILVIYCQRLNAKKNKYKRGHREATPPMTYDPIRDVYTIPGPRSTVADSRAERMYEPNMNGGAFRDGYARGSATQDAGKEFDVTLMISANSNHNLLHVPSPETCESYCSDGHNDTISTSHTRTNTTDGSIGSQSDGGNHYHSIRHHQYQHYQPPPRYETHVANSNGYITP